MHRTLLTEKLVAWITKRPTSVVALIWKIFWLAGGIYGLGMTVVFLLQKRGSPFLVIRSGLSAGLFFGVIAALGSVLLQLTAIQVRGFTPKGSNLSVVQRRFLLLQLPYEQAFSLCQQAVQELPTAMIRQADRPLGKIMARTRLSWSSYGEEIQIVIHSATDSTTEVFLKSQPLLRTTFVDCGKNLSNAENIHKYLRQYEIHQLD